MEVEFTTSIGDHDYSIKATINPGSKSSNYYVPDEKPFVEDYEVTNMDTNEKIDFYSLNKKDQNGIEEAAFEAAYENSLNSFDIYD